MTDSRVWQTETLRFSFLGAPDASTDLITFESLTGHEAESVTTKKSQNLRNEDGVWEDLHLIIAVQPGRIDVVLNPRNIEETGDGPSLPHIGDVGDISERLASLFSSIKMPKSARLAVGAKLNLATDSQSDSIIQLTKYAPFLQVDRDCIDVVFQQNKPKKIKQSGIELNRLTKWSQLVMQFVQMPVGEVSGFVPHTITKNFLQLELDINTSITAPLPHPDAYGPIIAAMFDELKAAATLEGK